MKIPFRLTLLAVATLSLATAATAQEKSSVASLAFLAGSWRGIPISTMHSTCHQVALDFVMEGVVPGSHEPPAYAVVRADADQTIVHSHAFLDQTNTFML